MSSEEKEFIILKVRLLFTRINEGKVKFVADRVPHTIEALEAVRFDTEGNPIYETITGPVRAAANAIYSLEVEGFEEEAQKRERESPVHELLGEPVKVPDDILKECSDTGNIESLAFELYKETATVLAVSSSVSDEYKKGILPRNQAVCAGLLVRIVKFMTAVMQLSASTNRAEVVMSLNRSIQESEINLRFLLLKREGHFFDQFVKFSLGPEREMYDIVQRNIASRGGDILPIEQRILGSIERVCRLSAVDIKDVKPKSPDWGAGVRNRLEILGEKDLYVSQRIGSHAIHGTWIDLLLHNLDEKDGGFTIRPEWSPVDSRLMLPLCRNLLKAADDYISFFFPHMPEVGPLFDRIEDLRDRIQKVDNAAEDLLVAQQNRPPKA